MLRKSFLGCGLVTAWAIAALAQAPAGELDRVRELVAAGAAPRSALERAQAEVDDRQDEATLRRTLYGMIAIEEINARTPPP
jgi:multidrug resistance efflux pump